VVAIPPRLPSIVRSTSTLLPGRMDPPTPDATLGVWMVKARIPSGTSAAIPHFAPSGAGLPSSDGSPLTRGTKTALSGESSTLVRAPGGSTPLG
jgi:hypothetical protein